MTKTKPHPPASQHIENSYLRFSHLHTPHIHCKIPTQEKRDRCLLTHSALSVSAYTNFHEARDARDATYASTHTTKHKLIHTLVYVYVVLFQMQPIFSRTQLCVYDRFSCEHWRSHEKQSAVNRRIDQCDRVKLYRIFLCSKVSFSLTLWVWK